MSFISNSEKFTLGDGVYNNIHSNFIHNAFYGKKRYREAIEGAPDSSFLEDEPARKRRRDEEEEGVKVIRNKHLKLTLEIGKGPGYFLHAGETKGRAVIVKVFSAGPAVREQLESTVALSKGLMHPNILRIEGVSSPASLNHFIAYENAHWKTAEGPLAAALKDDLTRSVTLGFKMVAGLSSGMNHLSVQGISLASLAVENFDIFLDLNDRFLISVNPPTSSMGTVTEDRHQDDNTTISWDVFNALCQKVLRSANRVLHNEDIDRKPVVLDLAARPSIPHKPSATSGLASNSISELPPSPDIPDEPPVRARREYVWRTIDRGQQSLANVASRIYRDLDMELYSLNKLAWRDGRSAHRCAGYIREEITLATTTGDSAVVSHDAPSPLEICSVCHEEVGIDEVFQCICGDPSPGSRPTVRCQICKFWSHGDCVGNGQEFACEDCIFGQIAPSISGPSQYNTDPSNGGHDYSQSPIPGWRSNAPSPRDNTLAPPGFPFRLDDAETEHGGSSAGTSKSHKSAGQESPSTSPSYDGAGTGAPGGFFAAHQQQQQPIEWRLPPSLARSEAAFRPQRPDAVPRPRSEDAYPLRSAGDALHARAASEDEAFPPPRSTASDDVRTCGCGDGCACPGCALHATAPPPEHASCAAAACGGACLDCTILSLPDFSAVVGFGGGGGGRAQAGLRFADDYGAGGGGEYDRLELEGYEERGGVEGLGVEGFEERLEGYDEAFALDAYGAGAGAATYDASQAQAIDEWIREVSALPPASPVPPFEFPDGAAVFGDPTAPSPFHTQQEQRQREEEQMFGEDGGANAFGQPAWGAVEMFDVDVGVELDGDTPALVAPAPGALKLNGLAPPGSGVGDVHFLTVPGPGAHARSRTSSSASSEVSAGAGGGGAGLAGVGGDLAGLSLDAPKPTASNPHPHPAVHPNVNAQSPGARALFAFPPPAFMDDEQMLFY
ncbi:hypothetical protein DFH09DRAFT_1399094 [Mycena vulgaris]|nr:hypothetical protein DFH09DRAFT_1399094 [Mycena vulgaris]